MAPLTKSLPLLFHAAALGLGSASLFWHWDQDLPKSAQRNFAGHFVLGEVWVLVLHALYFVVALLSDLAGCSVGGEDSDNSSSSTSSGAAQEDSQRCDLCTARDYLFSVFPAAALTLSLLYYSLYYVDPAWVVPKGWQPASFLSLAGFVRVGVPLCAVLETHVARRQPLSARLELSLVMAAGLLSVAWLLLSRYQSSAWTYGVLEHLTPLGHVALDSAGIGLLLVMWGASRQVRAAVAVKEKQA